MSRAVPVSAETVAYLEKLRAEGLSLAEIARRAGLAKSTVAYLLKQGSTKRPVRRPAMPHANAQGRANPGTVEAAQRPAPAVETRTQADPWPEPWRAGRDAQGLPPGHRGPHPMRDEEPSDHPRVRGLSGW